MTSNLPYTRPDTPVLPDDDGNLDLDALLADSIQHKQDLKTTRKEPSRNKQSLESSQRSREYKQDNTRSEKYALGREWKPIAAVAIFHTQRCVACGTNHTHFMGVFQRQTKTNGGISGVVACEQWVRATDRTMIDGLPKEQKETDEPVDMCICCTTQLGYPPKLFA